MTPDSQAVLKNSTYKFLLGGGEMGKLMRSIDWSKTSLGNPKVWPQSLRTSVSICLNSRFPISLFWGSNFVKIYNDAYRDILGAKHPKAMGSKGADVWPEIWPVIGPMLKDVLQKSDAIWSEDQLLMLERNGYPEKCYFTFSYSSIHDETESIGGVFCAVTETTKKVLTEKHLKKQLNNLFVQAPIAISIARGENYVVEFANERMLELWGKKSEQVLDKPVFEGIPDAKGQGFEKLLDNVYNTGKRFIADELPISLIRQGKTENIFVKFVYEPLRGEDGTISGIMTLADEITEQVITRKKIELSEERLRLAIEATSLGTWDFFPLTGLLNWSDECKKIYGFPLEKEVDYEIYLHHIYPEDKETVLATIGKAMEPHGAGTYSTEHRIIRYSDNAVRWVHGKGKVFFGVDMKPNRLIGTVLDVTEAKLKEEALRENEERLRLAIESGRLGTYELDIVASNIIISPRLAEIFGLDPSKKSNHQDLKNALHPDDVPMRNEAHIKAKETGILFYEARVVWPDETIHWVRLNGTVMYDDKGTALRTYGTAVDITEQKRSEEILKESEQKFRLIADAIPHMVWAIEPDGTISYINKQWADWSGLTLEEINNGGWIKIFHPEDFKKVADGWQQSFQNKTEYFGEYRIKDLTGKYFWFMGKTVPIKNEKGNIIKWIGTTTNIDEQKNIEVALKESEEQFRQLADSMPQIVWTARPDGYLDYYNKKWYDFTGFEPGMDAVTARDKILHPDDVQLCNDTWYNSVKTGKPYHIEYRFKNRKKPGTYCWYLGKALPIYNSEGKVIKWYGTCTDINEQKETEALLKESEENFRLMADAMPQQVWTANAEGALDYVNQRTANYFGKTAGKIIGSGWQELIHPNDLPTVLESWGYSLKTFEPYQVEFRLRGKNDVYRWHLGRATPFFNKNKEVKWFGTNTDIEEHKYTEQKKDEFISIASHELKTPITSLKGIVYILKTLARQEENSQELKLLATMDNQLTKLTKLMSDLLDVNKIEGHHLQLNKEDFDFKDMIEETVESVQHTSLQHSLVIESIESVIYNGDKLRLEQVVTNLLTNAIKYSPNAEKVIIRYDNTDDNIVVSVQDFGIGIERENITKLFERFYRVNNALRFGGLGLGLYISANIIKSHNGSFWIESEVGKGSIFYFLLPRNKSQHGINIQTDNFSYYADGQVKINYNKENDWIEADWTGFQNLESVQRGALIMLDLLKKNHCTKVLNDNTHVLGTWSEASEWGGNIWFPQMQNAGLKYFAWIYSPSTFSQLAAEKSVDIMAGSITTRFFNNIKEAELWLKGIG